jgi:replication factor A1
LLETPFAAMDSSAFFPIREISTYHHKWTICARVTAKSQTRTFRKGSGEGKVFSVDLLDAEGGEIRASFFNDAATLFQDKLVKGKCFTFSGGSVRVANRQYNQCNHRYELSFDKMAKVDEVNDVAGIQDCLLKLTDLRTAQTKPLPFTSDFCGIITSFTQPITFVSKDGKDLTKRELTIADNTATSITVAIWGDRAKMEDSKLSGNPAVILQGVSVKEWNTGRSGSLLAQGEIIFDGAKYKEIHEMKQWWADGGSSKEIKALSVSGTGARGPSGTATEDLSDMRRQAEQVTAEKGQAFTVVARLSQVQMRKQGETQPLYYMGCQEPREDTRGLLCNRRVDESGFCSACGRVVNAAPRLTLRCKFSDFTDSPWLTTFHEASEKVVGLSGKEVKELEALHGRDAAETAIRKAYLQEPMQITVRAKMDSYNGETRTNVTCVDARPVSRGERGRAMLREIAQMLAVKA